MAEEERIHIPVAAVAAYVTVITTDLLIKLGHTPTCATVRAFRKATTSAIRNGALEKAPEDYRDQIELLIANEVAEKLLGEQHKDGHVKKEKV